MAMRYVERELRATEDPRDTERADQIADMLNERGEDIPFREISFSQEGRNILKSLGFQIFLPKCLTLKDYLANGRLSPNALWDNFPGLPNLQARRMEIAFKPNQLFIPTSNKKTLAEQENIVDRFSSELQKTIPGVKAIIGEAAEYIELAFAYLDAKSRDPSLPNHDIFAVTKTLTISYGKDKRIASVGPFIDERSLEVYPFISLDRPNADNDFAFPLIVPAAA